jgi:hypothetical protein
MGLILLFIARSHGSNPGSAPAVRSVFEDAAPEEARLIPGIEDYRLATLGDFDPDAAARLGNYGQPVSGEIPGAFSAFGKSRAYVFVAEDATWRIVILADGKLRCDAQYRRVAIVARIPKQAIQKIVWADPPPQTPRATGCSLCVSRKIPARLWFCFYGGARSYQELRLAIGRYRSVKLSKTALPLERCPRRWISFSFRYSAANSAAETVHPI